MARHLDGELQWLSKEDKCYEQMANASYLREVLQRLILNFLFKYKGEPFMHLQKHDGNRAVEEMIQQSTGLSAHEIALRQRMGPSSLKRALEEEDRQGAVKRRKGNTLFDNGNDSD